MNADFKVLMDACVLANFGVCDLYLRLSEKPRLILPKWTEQILEEVYFTHTEKLGWDYYLADSFQNALREAFPESVITGYEDLIPVMTNHEKDRHVLAAAVRDKLDIIITFNLKDFKPEHLDKWGIKAIHPQDYLLTLYSMNSGIVLNKLSDIAQNRKIDSEDVAMDLGKTLPDFSSKLLKDMGREGDT